MRESADHASSRRRRANWVGLRTLRQLPQVAGDTAGGEPVYEIQSVRLVLDGTAATFVRLVECSRCGRETPGEPVLTPADLDGPLRPVVCTDCVPGEEATAAAWRDELAALRTAADDTRAELHRLAEAQAELLGERPARFDLAEVERLIATRLAETEARLAHQIATQWGDLETAIEGSVNAFVAGFVRANQELAGGQAVLEERVGAVADEVRRATLRMETLLERLAALEETAPPAAVATTPAGGFLDSLDRRLEAAARRLAARAEAGAGRNEP